MKYFIIGFVIGIIIGLSAVGSYYLGFKCGVEDFNNKVNYESEYINEHLNNYNVQMPETIITNNNAMDIISMKMLEDIRMMENKNEKEK